MQTDRKITHSLFIYTGMYDERTLIPSITALQLHRRSETIYTAVPTGLLQNFCWSLYKIIIIIVYNK
jgi:hypothetical protein